METAIYREVSWCEWCKQETIHLWEDKNDGEDTTVVRLCLRCNQTRIVKRPSCDVGGNIANRGNGQSGVDS